jgi:hypothetical protein
LLSLKPLLDLLPHLLREDSELWRVDLDKLFLFSPLPLFGASTFNLLILIPDNLASVQGTMQYLSDR